MYVCTSIYVRRPSNARDPFAGPCHSPCRFHPPEEEDRAAGVFGPEERCALRAHDKKNKTNKTNEKGGGELTARERETESMLMQVVQVRVCWCKYADATESSESMLRVC
jgi:hypothetical protein